MQQLPGYKKQLLFIIIQHKEKIKSFFFLINSWNGLRFQGQQAEYDFKGGAGAGAASVVNQCVPKTKIQRAEQESPKTPLEDDLSDHEINPTDTKELVPVRHSTRTAKKSYKYKPLLIHFT